MNQQVSSTLRKPQKPLIRSLPLLFTLGIINIAVFLVAISWLYIFLFKEPELISTLSFGAKLLIDLALLSFMSVPHSLLLEKEWKLSVLRLVPSELFFTVYSLHASLSLIALFYFWRPIGFELYELDGVWRYMIWGANILSWIYMGYALFSTGAFKHNGVEQWWNEMRGRKTKYSLPYKFAYRQVRHPIFLAFFLMIWIVPQMTLGRLVIALYWSCYLIIGTLRKEDKLKRNVVYQNYMSKVSAYPFFPKRAFKDTFKRGM